jgi:DNA-binding CsgD family transcriptional regulator
MQLWFATQLAKVSLAQGRTRTAVRLAGEAVGIAHQLNDVIQLQTSLATLAEAQAVLHEIESAERTLAELDSMQQSPWLFCEPGLARPWLMVSKDDLVSARRELEAESERGLACDDLRAASLALHALVRIGDARIVGDRLHEIAERVEGDLVPLQARHARAAARQDAPGLEKVAADFLELTGTLLAAEAYCDATTAYRAKDCTKEATAAARQATLLLGQCEGALTPASQLLAERPRLTQAERRTALLAARGRSNRDIAAAEQVSVRTVEYRLQGVYDKLGISSRRALADALGADTDTTRT